LYEEAHFMKPVDDLFQCP